MAFIPVKALNSLSLHGTKLRERICRWPRWSTSETNCLGLPIIPHCTTQYHRYHSSSSCFVATASVIHMQLGITHVLRRLLRGYDLLVNGTVNVCAPSNYHHRPQPCGVSAQVPEGRGRP